LTPTVGRTWAPVGKTPTVRVTGKRASVLVMSAPSLQGRLFFKILNSALHLQSELPEVHPAYAWHLYEIYRDYEPARVQLAMARPGLPKDSTAIVLAA
jgi:hypothetical protein